MTRIILIYLAILLFSIGPLLLAISASLVGQWLGCQVNEASAHPCNCCGRDIGGALYACFLMGWATIFTGPLGVLLAIGYSLWLRG